MAKDDKKNIYNTTMGQVSQSEQKYNALSDTIGGRGDTTWDRATENYNPAFQGYSNYAAGGGLTPEDIDRMRGAWKATGEAGGGGGGGGWGGISANLPGSSAYANLHSAYANAYRPDYGEADTGFRKLASKTGGFDEDQLNKIYGNVDTLTGIGQTGGITDEDKQNIMRQSMLDQEKTGGYSEQDKALVRAKSAASSPAYFGALKDNLQRQRSQTGNLANAGAVDFKLARQGAQQQGQDRLTQEMGLQESIRGGKERAGQFLSDQQMQLTGLRTANQLAGAQAGGGLGLSTQQGITANQARGLAGLQESQTGLGQWGLGQAGGLDQFGLAQAGGLDQFGLSKAQLDMQAQIANAQGAAAGGAGRAAQQYQSARDQAEFEQWVTQYGNQQKQYGIGGLESLYGTNLGASQNYSGMSLDALNSKYGTQGQLLGLANQTRGRTAMENMSTIGGLVGSVAGVDWSKFGGGGQDPYTGSTGWDNSGVNTGVSFGGGSGDNFGGYGGSGVTFRRDPNNSTYQPGYTFGGGNPGPGNYPWENR